MPKLISSTENHKLKTIRRLTRGKRARARSGMFVAEGEDLVEAAAASGWEPELLLRAGVDVEPALLAEVSTLGSGTRVLAVYRERWAQPGGELSVYLHAVADPGNIGTIIRSAHAFGDGPVVLGPACADPYSPKAIRASMGSIFARPPARAAFEQLRGTTIALDARAAQTLEQVPVEPPTILCLGAERDGLPAGVSELADVRARIAVANDGPQSLNVAMAATVALYERNRMAHHV